jgi:hypothetical protein
VTTEDLLRKVRAAGADVVMRGGTVAIVHPRCVDLDTIHRLRLCVGELREALKGSATVTHGKIATRAKCSYVRGNGRQLSQFVRFTIGQNGLTYKRCDASWLEHYPARPHHGIKAASL